MYLMPINDWIVDEMTFGEHSTEDQINYLPLYFYPSTEPTLQRQMFRMCLFIYQRHPTAKITHFKNFRCGYLVTDPYIFVYVRNNSIRPTDLTKHLEIVH